MAVAAPVAAAWLTVPATCCRAGHGRAPETAELAVPAAEVVAAAAVWVRSPTAEEAVWVAVPVAEPTAPPTAETVPPAAETVPLTEPGSRAGGSAGGRVSWASQQQADAECQA